MTVFLRSPPVLTIVALGAILFMSVGLAAARGYDTSMWLGRKGVRIEGADCYHHYFSGRGRDIATRFALPAVTDHVWKALYSGSVDSREEFIESQTKLSELSALQSRQCPQFAYLHFLDLHAPYRPSSLTEPSAHEEKMGRFMSACYRVGCDLAANEALIAHATSSFERSLPDVDRHLSQLLTIAESRERPYVLIVTADQGELFGQYDGFGHTGGFVPELLSLPFVVYDSRYDYRAGRNHRRPGAGDPFPHQRTDGRAVRNIAKRSSPKRRNTPLPGAQLR